jgi:hypothetical protein
MPAHGKITVNRRLYLWEVRDAASELFPTADKVLIVRSEDGRSEFLLGLRTFSQNYTCIGPAFIRAVEREIFPSVEVGKYYLFPAFKEEKAGGIHGENIRSIVASLLNGRRLRRVNSHGLPLARPRIGLEGSRTNRPAIRVWHFPIVAAGIAAGASIAWYFGQADVSLVELFAFSCVAVLLTWGLMGWLLFIRHHS